MPTLIAAVDSGVPVSARYGKHGLDLALIPENGIMVVSRRREPRYWRRVAREVARAHGVRLRVREVYTGRQDVHDGKRRRWRSEHVWVYELCRPEVRQ